jgi:hypothetical protein
VRHLFLALLAINVAFFGWARWIDRPLDVAVVGSPAAAIASLELRPVPAAPVAAPAPLTRCKSIGPFPDSAAASAAADALRGHGLQPRERSVESSVPDGYWVYVEDLKDAAARRKVISTLNAAGMKDAAAMADESERVSVGVFTDQKHAVHRAEQVQELGFKPVLSVHQRAFGIAWLDVELKPNEPDPAPGMLPNPPTNTKAGVADAVRVIDCPAKGVSG